MGLTHGNGCAPTGPSEHREVAGPRAARLLPAGLGSGPSAPRVSWDLAGLPSSPLHQKLGTRFSGWGTKGADSPTAKHPPPREQSWEGARMLLPGEAGRWHSWGRAAPDSSHPGCGGPARSPATISLTGPETLSPPGPSASSQGSHACPMDHLQPAAAQRALAGLGHGGLQLSEPRTSETAGKTSPQEPRVLNAPSRVSWAVAHPELQLSPRAQRRALGLIMGPRLTLLLGGEGGFGA